MEDKQIVELYWQRDERAIGETKTKYEAYCSSIARRILTSAEDAEECVADTWLGAWNSLPPHRPERLAVFLGKITRRLSLKRLRAGIAEKRGGGEVPEPLAELEACVPAGRGIDEEMETLQITAVINAFLSDLPEDARRIFVCRYWYCDPIGAIAERFGFSESKVKMSLSRTREGLAAILKKEGVFL